MSQDLFSRKPGKRNWARGNPGLATGTGIAGPLPTSVKRIARGTMILGTLAGLAFITSPWWRQLPQKPDPMRRRIYIRPASPSVRIDWSRR
jgi:hypothetical protein